ncbi:putative minor tail subunit [Bacillus phage vB_BspP_Dartukuta]|nr:putative minor tail subunit [Bacillus phage vB_BspP_Dartukuta]
MANTLFDFARQRFLEAQLNWMTDTIKVILVDTGAYTPQTAVHQYLADIPISARIAGPVTLTSKTTTGGAADAADVTFTSVTGASIESIIIYSDSGTESTSPLIAYIDTATGLPITPNGGDIIVTWDNGTNKIFKV